MRPEELSRVIRNENRLGKAGSTMPAYPIRTGTYREKRTISHVATSDEQTFLNSRLPMEKRFVRKFFGSTTFPNDMVATGSAHTVSFRGNRFPIRDIGGFGAQIGPKPKKGDTVAVAFSTKGQGHMLGKINSGHLSKHVPGSSYGK